MSTFFLYQISFKTGIEWVPGISSSAPTKPINEACREASEHYYIVRTTSIARTTVVHPLYVHPKHEEWPPSKRKGSEVPTFKDPKMRCTSPEVLSRELLRFFLLAPCSTPRCEHDISTGEAFACIVVCTRFCFPSIFPRVREHLLSPPCAMTGTATRAMTALDPFVDFEPLASPKLFSCAEYYGYACHAANEFTPI